MEKVLKIINTIKLMYKNPNYQKEYHKKYYNSENGKEIKKKSNLKYFKTDKYKETREKYNKKNKQKKKEYDRNYYFSKTKYNRELPDKPRVEIVNKPIVINFS